MKLRPTNRSLVILEEYLKKRGIEYEFIDDYMKDNREFILIQLNSPIIHSDKRILNSNWHVIHKEKFLIIVPKSSKDDRYAKHIAQLMTMDDFQVRVNNVIKNG